MLVIEKIIADLHVVLASALNNQPLEVVRSRELCKLHQTRQLDRLVNLPIKHSLKHVNIWGSWIDW